MAETYDGHQGFLDVWRDLRQDMAEVRAEPEQMAWEDSLAALERRD